MLGGFPHDPAIHRFAFFNPTNGRNQDPQTYSYPETVPDPSNGVTNGGQTTPANAHKTISYDKSVLPGPRPDEWSASFNNLGYSPVTLQQYLSMLRDLGQQVSPGARRKAAIISVTGTEEELPQCASLIASFQDMIPFQLAMEVNLSCPNISGSSPLAYDREKLTSYLKALPEGPQIPVGIKLPPYTYKEQFQMLKSALSEAEVTKRISFITAVNTLGSCCIMEDGEHTGQQTLPYGGLGGMAGPPLHPLALGNVVQLREHTLVDELQDIELIGVGGVSDGKGFNRMRSMGCSFVALATALGKAGGPQVFVDIAKEINGDWKEYDEPRGSEEWRT